MCSCVCLLDDVCDASSTARGDDGEEFQRAHVAEEASSACKAEDEMHDQGVQIARRQKGSAMFTSQTDVICMRRLHAAKCRTTHSESHARPC